MALPTKVIERLGWEKPKTPGWSGHLLMFTFTIFIFTLLTYLGLQFGYKPYLATQLKKVQTDIDDLGKKIPVSDQKNLATFYSTLSNLKTLLAKHVYSSRALAWVEENTGSTVYLTKLFFTPAKASFTTSLVAKSFDDMIQQIRLFETHPDVRSATVGGIGKKEETGGRSTSSTSNEWNFNVTFVLDPKIIEGAATKQ